MSDKITAEKLKAVYENSEQVKALNTELESILYGADTGGKGYYDVFWDTYQVNGTRTGYNNAFGNERWTDAIFKPKYDFLGIKSGTQMFSYAQIKNINKTIEVVGSASYLFSNSFVNYIQLLRVIESVNVSTWFSGCTYLITVNWDGVIGSNLNMSACTKLSKVSIQSAFNCLSDTVSGKTLTLSKTAVNNAFKNGSTGDEWLALVSTKPNWTISLSS